MSDDIFTDFFPATSDADDEIPNTTTSALSLNSESSHSSRKEFATTDTNKAVLSDNIQSSNSNNVGMQDNRENDCAICLCDLSEASEVAVLNGCIHSFHFLCIMKWSSEANVCPLCKKEFSEVLIDKSSIGGMMQIAAIAKKTRGESDNFEDEDDDDAELCVCEVCLEPETTIDQLMSCSGIGGRGGCQFCVHPHCVSREVDDDSDWLCIECDIRLVNPF